MQAEQFLCLNNNNPPIGVWGLCDLSLFCYVVLSVLSSFATGMVWYVICDYVFIY